MNYEPYCGVCGRSVAPDTDHVRVEVEKKRMDDRDDQDEYYLHQRCAMTVFGGWESP